MVAECSSWQQVGKDTGKEPAASRQAAETSSVSLRSRHAQHNRCVIRW
jgi:hypothetical protein